MTSFIASLTNLTTLLPQSHDSSRYVSRPILAPPSLWPQKNTDLRVHDFAHSADLWHQRRLANVTCPWGRRLYGITSAVSTFNLTWQTSQSTSSYYTDRDHLTNTQSCRWKPTFQKDELPENSWSKGIGLYRGADQSLAQPGRKQANVSARMAWISFGALPCPKKKKWWQLASRCCWIRARPWHASVIVSFLVGLRTYQHLGT